MADDSQQGTAAPEECHPVLDHSYFKSPEGVDVLGMVTVQPAINKRQMTLTNLDKNNDTREGVVLNLLRDLTRQLRRERGEKLSPVVDPHDISHEALCALSQDQIYSLMTSNSVNYDIIHHIMQLKKMAEEQETKPRQPVAMDTSNSFEMYDPNSAFLTPTSTVAMPTSSQPVSIPSSAQLSQGVLSQAAIANLDPEQRTSLMNTLVHNLVASGNMQLLSGGEEGGNPLNAILQSLLALPQKTEPTGEQESVPDPQLPSPDSSTPVADPDVPLAEPDVPLAEPDAPPSDPIPNSDVPSPPPMESGPRCTNIPCSKTARLSDEWGLYYCSEECLVQHSRLLFNTWVRERKARLKKEAANDHQ